MKRYFYILALRGNSNAVEPDSNYRAGSGQVRAETMDEAFKVVCLREAITRERDPAWTMQAFFNHYKNGNSVSVYISPMADDETKESE